MSKLYDILLGIFESRDYESKNIKGLFVSIDGFEYGVSFSDDEGYMLASAEQAKELISYNEGEDLDLLCGSLQAISDEWEDTLMTAYQESLSDDDKNYHAMNDKSNWV